jgi:hypothetical protein
MCCDGNNIRTACAVMDTAGFTPWIIAGAVLLSTTVAALAAAVGVSTAYTNPLTTRGALQKGTGSDEPALFGLGGDDSGETVAAATSTAAATTKVVPLTWNPTGFVYMVSFTAGTSPVTAAFDTGSARFIVATADCSTCTGPLYNPAASPTAVMLVDPRKAGAAGANPDPSNAPITPADMAQYRSILCTDTAAYVSQTDSIQMYEDTVTFPRRAVAICPSPETNAGQGYTTDAGAAPDLVITNFPIGGVYANTGSSSLNILGMAPVLSSTTINVDGTNEYLMPSCQTTRIPAYESAVLAAISSHYTNAGLPTVWSQYLGVDTGYIVFAPFAAPCVPLSTITLIPTLKDAPSAVSSTPSRYYVAPLVGMYTGPRGGPRSAFQTLAGAPQALVLDTGTTQFMVPPGGPVLPPGSLAPGQVLVVVLGSGSASRGGQVAIQFENADLGYGPDGNTPVMAAMTPSVASVFSSANTVGILGCTAQRGLYVQYNVTAGTVSIGGRPATWTSS